jgi:hypothetical protein
MVLLKCLWRLYVYGSIFKCCQCIITAPINNHCTCWRTNPLITKHWLIRGTSVSVYIDHVTHFNRTTTVTNLTRAYNTIRIPCPETRLFRVPFKWYKHWSVSAHRSAMYSTPTTVHILVWPYRKVRSWGLRTINTPPLWVQYARYHRSYPSTTL